MNKNKKFIFLFIIIASIIFAFMIKKTNDYTRSKIYSNIEELIKKEDYTTLQLMFSDDEEIYKILKISKKEAEEISFYFSLKSSYLEEDFNYIASTLKHLKPELCWKFKKEAKLFKDSVMKSSKYKKALIDLENETLEYDKKTKKYDEFKKWRINHISEIAPFEGMSEDLIRKTCLGEENFKYVSEDGYNSDEDFLYEAHYSWKNEEYETICDVVVGEYIDESEPTVKRVNYKGNDWKIESLFGYNDFKVYKYIGKLKKNNNKKENNYSDNKKESVEDIIKDYISEYDVYEYSDADEFYYDHKDDFSEYYEAEQYYDDAWSLIDKDTEYLIE